MEEEIIEFIKRRFPIDNSWSNGNCYYFALILQKRFGGELYYDSIVGHFFLKNSIGNFDYNGKYEPKSEHKLEDIKKDDLLWYERLVKYCIL